LRLSSFDLYPSKFTVLTMADPGPTGGREEGKPV
jgi:hypothetical protein